jgi:GT2 family glycosyltransferase
MFDISVVIVTWNSANDIVKCVSSIFSNSYSDKLNTETIIIDNDSQDETCSTIEKIQNPNLHTYQNHTNTGYTKGVNLGISYTQGKYILLLNPDIELKNNCIGILYNFLESNPGYSAAAPLLINEDGTIQYSIRNFPTYWTMYCEFSLLAHIFPRSTLFGKWKMKYYKYDKDSDVNQPMAAALLIRKNFLDQFGDMDERFVMFFNDVDLCRKIVENGRKIRFITAAQALHKIGTSVYKDRVRMIKTWNKDCIQYFKKYHNNFFLLTWLKISLKISEIFRILFYKITKK